VANSVDLLAGLAVKMRWSQVGSPINIMYRGLGGFRGQLKLAAGAASYYHSDVQDAACWGLGSWFES
jgi:hypothetical protein